MKFLLQLIQSFLFKYFIVFKRLIQNYKVKILPIIYKCINIYGIFLNSICILSGIFFLVILHTQLPITIFMPILFFILVYSSFIIYCKEFNIEIKYNWINNIVQRDYIFIIQRIIMIKIILLYSYIVSDYSFCASAFNKLAHDVFIGMGKNVGIQPETSVSTLETIGMCAVVGCIGYTCIKGYQLYTGTTPKSVNERFDLLQNEVKILRTNFELESLEHDHTRSILLEAQEKFANQNVKNLAKVARGLVELSTNNLLLNEEIKNMRNVIISTQDSLSQIVKNDISGKLTKISESIEKLNQYKNLDELTPEMRRGLQDLYNELHETIQSTTKLSETLPLPLTNEISPISFPYPGLSRHFQSKLNTQINKEIQQSVDENKDIIDSLKVPKISKFQRSQSVSENTISSTVSTVSGKYRISEQTDKHIILELIENVQSTTLATVNAGVKRVFRNVSADMLYTVVERSLAQVISGSITGTMFLALLETLGMRTPSQSRVPSTSENVGRTIASTVRDFINGLRNGS